MRSRLALSNPVPPSEQTSYMNNRMDPSGLCPDCSQYIGIQEHASCPNCGAQLDTSSLPTCPDCDDLLDEDDPSSCESCGWEADLDFD